MQRRQAFKFELRPNGEQRRLMRRFAGARRFVFNKGRALQTERFQCGEKRASYAELCRVLTGWKNTPELHWLKEAPVHVLQQSL